MRWPRVNPYFVALFLSACLILPSIIPASAVTAQVATPTGADSGAGKVLFFAAPGINPELVRRFANDGSLPAIAELQARGAGADGAVVAPFPATDSTILATLLTGTWPAENGIVGGHFYRTGSPDFADVTKWTDPDLLQADTLTRAAERAGKQVVVVGWEGIEDLDAGLEGPVIGDAAPLSQTGVLANFDLDFAPSAANQSQLGYERIDLQPADGWSNAPQSFSPAQESALTIRSLDPTGVNPDRDFNVYVYDATDDRTTNYDHVLVATEKDGAAPIVDLDAGAWANATVELSGNQNGQAAGLWFNAADLAPDLSRFRLYYTPISRVAATWPGCGDRAECTQPGGFEEAINRHLGAPMSAGVGALESGLIDEATFAAQGLTESRQRGDELRYLVDDLGLTPDLLLLGTSFPGALSKELVQSETAAAAEVATPMPAATPLARLNDQHIAMIRDSYAMADEMLATGRALLGPDATTLAVSIDDQRPSWIGVDAGQVLLDAGVATSRQPGNCQPGPVDVPPGTPDPEALPIGPAVKACWSGGTAQIYINLDGREAAGTVAEDDYDAIRDTIVAAFQSLRDPASGENVVAQVLHKENLRDVSGADALHPSRSGDVDVILLPPYRFDNLAEDMTVAAVQPLFVGGYLPSDAAAESGFFLATGPSITPGARVKTRAIDVAPTAAFLLGVPGPYNARGNILLDLLTNSSTLRQVTILDISDFHGQLTPLTAAADAIEAEGAVNSSYDVGGVAYLKPWFDRFRAQAGGPTLLLTAGDAVGATPPISSVFKDVPTIDAMNALGFTADSLGNHNFDAGAGYMFGTLAPIAAYPYLSANLVLGRPDLATPAASARFEPSALLDLDGVKLGLVGFSNPDIPLLTRPGALDPYRVIDPVGPVNDETARLREAGANAVVAMGHMGATGGTLTGPTGPLIDVANQLQGVNVVVGDHTDQQVSSTLANGTLIVENRSKGVMFTRVQLILDTANGARIYRTADFHRPWTIGITPDPEITSALDLLNAQLKPILGQAIGSAVQPILRADSCGMSTGRTCESLIGDVITDAMRTTYATDFALTNSGGIRADLTCPPGGADLCPDDGTPNVISEGQVLTVLPFGNVTDTLQLNGAELKSMLEAGVSRMPEASGGFPQVSGLCFTYDISRESGNRVTEAVRQATDGSCTGEKIDLTEAATYTLTTNDFTASGGDGYPVLLPRANSRDVLASVVTAYIAGNSALDLPGEPLSPQLEGRITCVGAGCPVLASS